MLPFRQSGRVEPSYRQPPRKRMPPGTGTTGRVPRLARLARLSGWPGWPGCAEVTARIGVPGESWVRCPQAGYKRALRTAVIFLAGLAG